MLQKSEQSKRQRERLINEGIHFYNGYLCKNEDDMISINNSEYRLSKYNYSVSIENSIRVMNLLSRSIIDFPIMDYSMLENHVKSLTLDEKELLIEYGFLVGNKINEYNSFRDFFRKRKNMNSIQVTVGFSMNCNFDCRYCIQKGNYEVKNNFTKDNIDLLFDWLLDEIKNGERFFINIFGGEPTLNIEAVYYFVKSCNHFKKEYGCYFEYQMVTNGFLLNAEMIKELISLGVKSFQITLDGVGDVHNQRRSPRFDSFTAIVNNILELVNYDCDITLLHVFDESNRASGKSLVDFFSNIIIDAEKRKKIFFNFVVTIPKDNNIVSCNNYIKGKEKYLTMDIVDYVLYAKGLGFSYVNTLDISCCFRQCSESFLIDPALNIYKCYSIFGNELYALGKITEKSIKEFFLSEGKHWSELDGFSKTCEKCNFVPFCRGGCQFAASELHNGEYGHPYCEKEVMEEHLRGFLINNLF